MRVEIVSLISLPVVAIWSRYLLSASLASFIRADITSGSSLPVVTNCCLYFPKDSFISCRRTPMASGSSLDESDRVRSASLNSLMRAETMPLGSLPKMVAREREDRSSRNIRA